MAAAAFPILTLFLWLCMCLRLYLCVSVCVCVVVSVFVCVCIDCRLCLSLCLFANNCAAKSEKQQQPKWQIAADVAVTALNLTILSLCRSLPLFLLLTLFDFTLHVLFALWLNTNENGKVQNIKLPCL